MQNLERMTAEGPGTNKIHNPFLRGLATVGDAVGSGLFPEFARFIPGTSAHHQQLIGQEEGQLAQEQGAQKAAEESATAGATQKHLTAEADELQHRGSREDAQAALLANNPNWEESKDLTVDPDHPEKGAQVTWISKKDPTHKLYVGSAAAKPTDSKESANVHILPDGSVVSVNHDSKTGKSTAEVVYKGDPKVETEVAKLEVNGKPHTVLVNKKDGTTIKDLGETGEKPPSLHVDTQGHQEIMKGKELLDKAEKDYRGAAQGAKTLTDFVDSAKAGNKVTAQALPLEGALEITTTAGTKRINRTEVENYAGAGSLWDNIMGKLGKLKSGQPIPEDVQNDSIKLAKILQTNAYKTYRDAHTSAVKRYGLKDEEPLPDPGKVYTQANVDAAVAAKHGTAQQIEDAFKAKGYVKQ